MPYAGGLATVELAVEPSDGTTTVEIAIAGPDDATASATPVSTDGGATWTASWIPSAAGLWIASWTVDGTGEGFQPQQVYVSRAPTAAELVAWRPELEDVAAYVPRTTLVGAVDGYGNPVQVFRDGPATGDDAATHPTASAAHRVLTDACSWVMAGAGDLDETLNGAASGLAARRAAGWLRYTWVDDADDRAHAEKLLAATDAELKQLAARNTDLTGVDPTDPADDVLPDAWWPTVADTWTC